MKKLQFLESFHLKIIAMIIMVVDHVGAYLIPTSSPWYLPLRIIGRISFPIFAFLIVEGIHYSKKPLNYLLRLAILGVIIDIGTFIVLNDYPGCVLTTFVFGGLIIYCLEKLKGWYKLLSIIPLTISFLSGFNFFPLRMQYGVYGIMTILIFYFAKVLTQFLSKTISHYGMDYDEYVKSPNFQLFYHLVSASIFIAFNMILTHFNKEFNLFFTANDVYMPIQSYSVLVCPFLLLYNGKRGYNAKWFQYGCYLFFPLQFVLLYLIKMILF